MKMVMLVEEAHKAVEVINTMEVEAMMVFPVEMVAKGPMAEAANGSMEVEELI